MQVVGTELVNDC